jgi:hypothetical protein
MFLCQFSFQQIFASAIAATSSFDHLVLIFVLDCLKVVLEQIPMEVVLKEAVEAEEVNQNQFLKDQKGEEEELHLLEPNLVAVVTYSWVRSSVPLKSR